MARGYRAIVELDGKEGALLTADRLFHEWVHNKYPLEGRSVRIECDEEGIYRFGRRRWIEDIPTAASPGHSSGPH